MESDQLFHSTVMQLYEKPSDPLPTRQTISNWADIGLISPLSRATNRTLAQRPCYDFVGGPIKAW